MKIKVFKCALLGYLLTDICLKFIEPDI